MAAVSMKVQKRKKLRLPHVIAEGQMDGHDYRLFGQGNGRWSGEVFLEWRGRYAVFKSKDLIKAGRIEIDACLSLELERKLNSA